MIISLKVLYSWALILVIGMIGLVITASPVQAQVQSLDRVLSKTGLEMLPQLDEREPIILPEGLRLTVDPEPKKATAPVEELPGSAKPAKPQVQAEIVPLTPVVAATPADLETWFKQYAQEYGVDVGTLQIIARCESGFNPGASNGPYGGLYQFHPGTWQKNRAAMGLDPNPSLRFSPQEAIRTAAFKISRDGTGAWPVCSS